MWVEMGASNLFRLVDSLLTLKTRPLSVDIDKLYYWNDQEFGGRSGVPHFISGETGGCSFKYTLRTSENVANYADTVALLGVSETKLIKIKTVDYSAYPSVTDPVVKFYEFDLATGGTPSWIDYIRNSDNKTTDVFFDIDKVFTTYNNPAVSFPQSYIEFLILPNNFDFDWQVKSVKISELVVGRAFSLGKTKYAGMSLSIQDFSRIERDDFGNAIVTKRPFAKRVTVPFNIPKSQVDLTQRVLADNRGSVALYIADDSVNSSAVFGLYSDFSITYEDFDYVVGEIEITGLPE
jgi:hypothetical protein